MASNKTTYIRTIISYGPLLVLVLASLTCVYLLLNLPVFADVTLTEQDSNPKSEQSSNHPVEKKSVQPKKQPSEKLIMGWLESVYIDGNLDHRFKAKLDSGAKTSSIHATNIAHFQKDGKDWVRFTVDWRLGTDKSVGPVEIERPVLEYKKIKLHNQMSMVRPVIELPIVLAGREYCPRFNLVDRSKFLYPVLLGRRFLRDVALIDPDNIFLTSRQLNDWLESRQHQNNKVVDLNH